ncbi:MAG: Unknown protein [uncultured Sulfurovum sp.]|uniref:Uncharacterized protein n=1 Tax=uncultured Sulfurovum sp. TaxID=269237 RepID=A0A6S6RU12_9BACT|nr:MAG: Unknown protein [uncultured Sulfurovum sp.]
MDYRNEDEHNNKQLRQKFNYVIEKHIEGGKKTLALKTFGYERENQVSNLCSTTSYKPSIKKMHMESMEKHHQIPLSIWDNNLLFEPTKIDQHIHAYKASLKAERISFEEEDNIFTNNKQLFKNLKGVWYAYLYPSNPSSAKETEGIWIVETTINDDYTVVDYWGNSGYLKIGKNQSLIIKEPYENNDLTVIRFSNRHVSFEHFRFTIVSNQNGTINEMVNFGFYSRKKYSPQEAKEILGDIEKVQLKLDLGFDGRLNKEGVVKY